MGLMMCFGGHGGTKDGWMDTYPLKWESRRSHQRASLFRSLDVRQDDAAGAGGEDVG